MRMKFEKGMKVSWKERIHKRIGTIVSSDRYWSEIKTSDTGIRSLDYVKVLTRKLTNEENGNDKSSSTA